MKRAWLLAVFATLASCGLPSRDETRLRNLIERLDASSIDAREDAYAEIISMGPRALPLLRDALDSPHCPECRERIAAGIEDLELDARIDRAGRYAFQVWAREFHFHRDGICGCPTARDFIELACDPGAVIRLADLPRIEITDAHDDQGRSVTLGETGDPRQWDRFVVEGLHPDAKSLSVRGILVCSFPVSIGDAVFEHPVAGDAMEIAGYLVEFVRRSSDRFVLNFNRGQNDSTPFVLRPFDFDGVYVTDSEGPKVRAHWDLLFRIFSTGSQLNYVEDRGPGEKISFSCPGLGERSIRSLSLRFVERTRSRRFPFEIRDFRLR